MKRDLFTSTNNVGSGKHYRYFSKEINNFYLEMKSFILYIQPQSKKKIKENTSTERNN